MALRSPFGRFRPGLPQVCRIYLAGLDKAAAADPAWVADFARHTLIVLHHNQLDHNPGLVRELRAAMGPGQRIAWDLSWCEFPKDWREHPPWSFDYIIGDRVNAAAARLVDTAGRDVELWPGTITANFLHQGYAALWRFVYCSWREKHIGSLDAEDIIFLDCGWDSVSWMQVSIDPFGAGLRTPVADLNLLARSSLSEIMVRVPGIIVNGGVGVVGQQRGRFLESADDNTEEWVDARVREAALLYGGMPGACSVVHAAPERWEWATRQSMRHPSLLVAVGPHGDHSGRFWTPEWDSAETWK